MPGRCAMGKGAPWAEVIHTHRCFTQCNSPRRTWGEPSGQWHRGPLDRKHTCSLRKKKNTHSGWWLRACTRRWEWAPFLWSLGGSLLSGLSEGLTPVVTLVPTSCVTLSPAGWLFPCSCCDGAPEPPSDLRRLLHGLSKPACPCSVWQISPAGFAATSQC